MHELIHDAYINKHNVISDNLHVNDINLFVYFNFGVPLCNILILYIYFKLISAKK